MADLLARFLQCPEKFKSSIPDLQSSTPPEGFSSQDWGLRHELPLHLINFLRDEAEPLLSLAQTSGATPGKTSSNRPAKYDYNSPLKPVLESPGKLKTQLHSENNKKQKKKVKLFSGKITGKANKSFSDVEEQLELRNVNGDARGSAASNNSVNGLHGIGHLPSSPNKNSNKNGFRKSQSTSLFSVPENGHEQDNSRKFRGLFGDNKAVLETPSSASNGGKHFKKKMSISPQTLSLADFIAPIENKRNGRKKTPRSPSKIKSSTPIEDHIVPRLENNLSMKVSKLDLDSAETFPEIGEPTVQRKRRMKPTLVSSKPDLTAVNPVFGQKVDCSNEIESPFLVDEVEKKSYDSREMVREIPSLLTPFKSGGVTAASTKTPIKTPSLSRSNSLVSAQLQLVSPRPELVQQPDQLEVLAGLYSHVLSHNLMPNFYVELYFVIELLLLDLPLDRGDSAGGVHLSTIHNCVHFACSVLGRVVGLLGHLDRTTCRALMDNPRLAVFRPAFSEQLAAVCDTQTLPSPLTASRANRSCRGQENVSLLTVSFQSETDNRSNFPSNPSFYDFKKQRDKFYVLIRKWGENTKGKDVQFESSFGAEVEKVMVMHQHPVNYYHFAKLWMAQLLVMCRGESDAADADTHQLMAELRKTDPVKCKRLAARLVTPGRCGDPCPPPSFSGAAEFFKDFLLACNSPKFVRHLRDLLVSEVARLNSVQLDLGDIGHEGGARAEDSLGWELSESVVGSYNEALVDQFQETLVTLRILAKFLGFLESFPYSDTADLATDHAAVLVGVRAAGVPALDLASCVLAARDSGRLVLTLPWVVEFLGQLDEAGHQLPYYTQLYSQLAAIYQTRLAPATPHCSALTAHFLSLYVGWLFEKKSFPRELLILAQAARPEPQERGEEGPQLDRVETVVSPGLVRLCCPWVGEVRTLLQQWEAGQRGSQLSLDKTEPGVYRKITPLAAPRDKKHGKLDKESVLQSQLEESFFHNQPKSLRRTVEYISERFTSNIIKVIRQTTVPQQKTVFTEALKKHEADPISGSVAITLTAKVPHHAQLSCEAVRATTELQLGDQLVADCGAAIRLLVAADTSAAVVETCVSIAARTVAEKVWQWVGQHVTLAYFTREFTIEAERVARQLAREHTPSLAPAKLFSGRHDPGTAPPSQLLITLKSHVKSLLLGDGASAQLSPDLLLSLISNIRTCLQSRCDLTQLAARAFETLSVDWTLALIVARPALLTEEVTNDLLGLWSLLTPPQLLSILCPRNLVLLAQARERGLTQDKLQQLLVRLVEAGLLPALALEAACLSLVREPRPRAELEMVAASLEHLAQQLDRGDLDWVPLVIEQINQIHTS